MKEEKNPDREALEAYLDAFNWQKEDEFKRYFLPRLSENYIIEKEPAHAYAIFSSRYGRILFYPRLNRCFLLKKSKWIKPGLQWIIKEFLLK
jgi:hypothetical protein